MARRKKSDTNPTTGSLSSSSSSPLANSTIPVVRKSQRQIAKKKLVENMNNINVQNAKTKRLVPSPTLNNKNALRIEVYPNSEVEKNDDNEQWSEKDTENLNELKEDCNDILSRDGTVNELVTMNVLENNSKLDDIGVKHNSSSIAENSLNKDHINCDKVIYNVYTNISDNSDRTDKIIWSDTGNEIQHVIEEAIICEEMQIDEPLTTVKDNTTIEVEEILLVNEPPFQEEEVIECTIIQNKDNVEFITESNCIANTEKSDRLSRLCLQDEVQDRRFTKCSFINNKKIEIANQTTNNTISEQYSHGEVDDSDVYESEKQLINDSSVNLSESSSSSDKKSKLNKSSIEDYEESRIKHSENNFDVNKEVVEKLKTCNSNLIQDNKIDNTTSNPDSVMFEAYKNKKKSTIFCDRKNLKSCVISTQKDKELTSQIQLEETPENNMADLQLTDKVVQMNLQSTNQHDQLLLLDFITEPLTSEKIQSNNIIDKLSLESNKLDFDNTKNGNLFTTFNRSIPCNNSPIHNDWDNNIHNIESKLQNFTINKTTNNVEFHHALTEKNKISKLNDDNVQSSSSVDDNVANCYNSCSEDNDKVMEMNEINGKNQVDMKIVVDNECQKEKKEYFTDSSSIQTTECESRLNENNLSGVRRSNRIKSQSLMRQKSRGRGLVTKPGLSETARLFNNQECNENVSANNTSSTDHSSFNESSYLNIDNQSETQSDKENNIKMQSQNISESSTSNTTSNNNNIASISNSMVSDYNTNDNKKPVKVKSRWRRSSELEMGNSIANRLSFGDIVTSCSEFASLSSVNINESFNHAHFLSKNNNFVSISKCKKDDLISQEISISTSSKISTNDLNSLASLESSNIDKAMSSMVIDQKDEKPLEEKRKKHDKKTNSEIFYNHDNNNEVIGDDYDNLEKNKEEQMPDSSKNVEMVLNNEDERELKERLSQFEYLKENLYLTERYTNKETKRMICDCFLTEEEIERGELGCGEDCLNRLLMIECGSRCTINDRCTNKRFQNCAYAKCQVFKTQKKGFGLRATADLPAGEFIMEYVGEVVNTKDFRKRAKEYSKDKNRHYYFMALKSDQIIDATMKGNISRFINHSCDPNAETQKWTVNGELRIGFFNRRFIAAGEEITFDYHFQRYGKEAQKCYCESANCRGWIGDTPEEEKEKTEKKEKRIGNNCGSGGATAAIITTGNNSNNNDKTERERDTVVYSKKKRNEAKTKVYFEDEDLEEEIEKLCTSGLKNRNHTLTLSRLMVRSREMEHRTRLLRLIQNGEQPCRRLFLDYHGLRLIWSYMMDIANIDTEKAQKFKLELLKALNTLPIPNKTMLMDSKVYNVVEKWSNSKSCLAYNNLNKVCEAQPEEDVNAIKTVKKDHESTISTTKIIEEIESNYDSNDNTSISCTDVDFNRISEQKKNQEITNDNSDSINIELNIQELASILLNNWSNLKEVFRIPKKERIEQMKEHEREADDGYRNENNGNKEELKRESCLSSLSSYEKHRSDRYYYGSKKEDSERNRERCSGDHHHHHHHHHSHNHTHNHHHHHHHRSERLDKRKSRDSPDHCSDQTSYKFKEKRTANDERTNLVPVPRLTKFERRQLFALKVAKEEEEERIRKQQQELWQQHEARCLALSMNPHTTAAVDPQTGYPLFFNAILGQWQSYPIQEDMCDLYHNRSTPITNDQQIQSDLQPVELVPSVIPQYTSSVTYTPLQTLDHQHTEQSFVDSNTHFQNNIISTHPSDSILIPMMKENGQLCVDNSVERQQFKEKEETKNDDDENGNRKDKRKHKQDKEMNDEKVDEEESYFISPWRNMEVEVEKQIEFMGEKNNQQKYFEQPKIQEKTENGTKEQIEDISMYQLRQPDSSLFSSQTNSQEYMKETNIGVEHSIGQQSEMPMLDLPPKWKCAKDSRGRFYYYHIKDRISQWLPPPPIHIDIQHDSSSSSEESSDDEGSLSSSDPEDILEDLDSEQIEIDGDSTKDDKDFLKKRTEKIKTSIKLNSRMDSLNQSNTAEMRRKRDKLVQERIISPRRESDQVDFKKYKDTKEKLRKRKERMKLREQMDKSKKHRRVNKTKSHAKHTAIKLQAIAQSNELTTERKIKDTFRINMANVIVKFLNPYRQTDCKLGRITNTEDFKYLARKLTHFVLAKELKHCKSIDELNCNDNVKHKAKDFVRKYMNKFGPVYQRLSDED